MVGLAIVAAIAAGWRKPARVTANPARARFPFRPVMGVPVDELRSPLAKRTPWWKRIRSVVTIPVLAVAAGAIVATVVGYGVATLIITLSDMLRR
jgi:hypothetical protein